MIRYWSWERTSTVHMGSHDAAGCWLRCISWRTTRIEIPFCISTVAREGPRRRGLGAQDSPRVDAGESEEELDFGTLNWPLCGVVYNGVAHSFCYCFGSSLPLYLLLCHPTPTLSSVAAAGSWSWRMVQAGPWSPCVNPSFCFLQHTVYLCQFSAAAVSLLMDVVFNGEVAMLIIGLCSILRSDPGLEVYGSSTESIESSTSGINSQNEGFFLGRRVRYCRSCKAYIRGFDHHCPAFGNCIGQKNYLLFMVLLFGFLIAEASYVACSSQYAAEFGIFNSTMSETSLSANLAVSTTMFSILQLAWQVLFLMWHVYCMCSNIRTDEWINWKKYPEFQFVHSQPGQSSRNVRFTNPYDKGILQNVKEFLASTR
ncbi:hypothetical protein FNV43_RR05168 [Rhamnella rubrinervis]|uniref:S-acyltransferase n=1 Tax=Rhamnella rubrinervis TaxID=2594499 RepID=A0A8K0HLP0_9ROSA|nr:hypothetical protein FNV43_RR05168 [Rhamnella rubrinervis]